ncbi:MAG: hydroxyethylthiazole kinase [Clostridia bacterium]|nr:hydroxyethylthiazole kinase [Clostridia bacterium]
MITSFEGLKKNTPLVHNITNYVTVNDVANMILAAGGAPLMADAIEEVEDIVSISSALYINVGTLNARTVESMVLAGKKANELGLPVVLDPVGVGASKLRNEAVEKLIETVTFSVIKGNISEIKAMVTNAKNAGGVDVQAEDIVTDGNLEETTAFLKGVAQSMKCVIVATGAIDIVTDGQTTAFVRNGDAMMSRITGTGCMLGSVIATYCGSDKERILEGTVTALVVMGLAGQYAADKTERLGEGIGSFRAYLLDAMSDMSIEQLEEGALVEIQE